MTYYLLLTLKPLLRPIIYACTSWLKLEVLQGTLKLQVRFYNRISKSLLDVQVVTLLLGECSLFFHSQISTLPLPGYARIFQQYL